MCLFIETIKIDNGKIYNLEYHNKRMNDTRCCFFGDVSALDLSDYIDATPFQSRHRCRVEYAETILKVEYFPYHIRPVTTLQLVEDNNIDYSYKRSDRSALNYLFNLKGDKADVLIVKNGLLTDTSIANIALYKEGSWFTPLHPLLKGTKRRELLERGIIRETDIKIQELCHYSEICLFNAMIEFGEIKFPVINISK